MFNVKVRVKFKDSRMVNTVVIRTRNEIATDAEKHATGITQSWEDVDQVEIIEVSTRPMQMHKFIVVLKLFYHSKPPKELKIHVTEEDKEKAALLMDDIVQEWNNWKEYEIITVIPLISKQWS